MRTYAIPERSEHPRHRLDEGLEDLRWSLARRLFNQAQC